ncbi:MAG: hypothetical protein ACLRFM_04015 [Alphaproteobacteria bacterium]
MKKFLFGLLGLLWAIPSWANCNLFDKNTMDGGYGYINTTGGIGSGGDWNHTTYIQVFPSAQYSLQGIPNYGGAIALAFYDATQTFISSLTGQDGYAHITTPSNAAYIRFTFEPSSLDAIQLERGDTATAYTPYNSLCATCDGQIVTYTSATGTVSQNGTPTPTNPIDPVFYTQGNMVLRKVGDYADTYDATTGKITRRVGVKVLDGVTAGAKIGTAWNTTYKRGSFAVSDMKSTAADVSDALSSHFEYSQDVYGAPTVFGFGTNNGTIFISFLGLDNVASADTANAWLAQQYAAGTPVTVWYPLATPVEETVSASYCQQAIKVATTKYVESQFSDLGTRLAAAVATVNTVVTNTINQAASIATLQSGKQTRPDETCPAGKKCLLVEDASGVPHWYEIFDPINRWMEAFFKTNPNGQYEENVKDFRRWQGNPDFRETYIDGSRDVYVRQWTAASPARTVGGMYQTLVEGDLENAGTWAVEYDGTEGDGVNAGAVYGIAKCTSVAGTFSNKLTSAQESAFYELPAPVGQTDNANYPRENFKNCWCKMTAVGVPGADGTAANGAVYPVNSALSAWVFYSTYSTAADCAYRCAFHCTFGVRIDVTFRTAVFGLSE